MLKFKLSRQGKKKKPSYRIVVVEHTKDPWGKALDIVGFYNPTVTPSEVKLKEDRIKHWLEQGAQPTETVHNVFVSQGLISEKKKNVSKLGKKFKAKVKAEKDKKEEEAKAAKEEKIKKAEEAKAAKEEKIKKAEEAKAAKEEEKKAKETPKEEVKKEEAPKEEAKA